MDRFRPSAAASATTGGDDIVLPENFLFGTSTAAYQIEGAAAEDGKGPSIWDTFTAEPGRIVDGASGAVACDHYHRWAEDIELMRRLGADGYRFSIAWPRIQPTGGGAANPAGLGFYDRLVDALLDAGIRPMVTLYHWDLPQALEDGGGWLDRETALRFGEYAAIMGDLLGDRVTHWCPVNEPNVVTLYGYGEGVFAPGKALLLDALPAAHHLLLAHGTAVQALRASGAGDVGTATSHYPAWPRTGSDADRAAAGCFDTLWNRLFADPILLGRYPGGLGEAMPGPVGEDLALIAQPLDFYGLNYYHPMGVRAASEGSRLPFERADVPGYPTTDFGWPIVPEAFTDLLVEMAERYPGLPPIIVTENGCSYATGPDESGVVDDRPRIDYLDAHLRAVAAAIGRGADVRGYYCWSLLDNFEWAHGFTQRFGLVHVDYDTLVRTPKRSFDWYADLIRAHHGTTD
ncbi:beta-glucosidase [Actinomadura craniellae]|uniref:Beta-glucosidase n=1 Tax=Actinomadura craniellae TaxID=2231787 RepID=A0A365HCS5_9ACTN|nr:GH1 family beta-glucosidase [Actinomadura craniellae]RAY16839.1 beta-glucosidase [Actinomadura craniellae]